MKKLLFAFMLIWIISASCEKWELKEGKLNRTCRSPLFELADLDSVKINLSVEQGIITEMFLTPSYFRYKHSFQVDSISDDNIYFHFQPSYYGVLEVEETDSENYMLIGHLHIKDPFINCDRWKYILYFK